LPDARMLGKPLEPRAEMRRHLAYMADHVALFDEVENTQRYRRCNRVTCISCTMR
jgi:hypothetical protein